MKLLLDQNISFRVVQALESRLPCEQVRTLGLENAKDEDIWRFARDRGYTIVTFDADFFDLVTLKGHPPKVIWLRTENITTGALTELLKKHTALITRFHQAPEHSHLGCLEIHS